MDLMNKRKLLLYLPFFVSDYHIYLIEYSVFIVGSSLISQQQIQRTQVFNYFSSVAIIGGERTLYPTQCIECCLMKKKNTKEYDWMNVLVLCLHWKKVINTNKIINVLQSRRRRWSTMQQCNIASSYSSNTVLQSINMHWWLTFGMIYCWHAILRVITV